MLAAHEKIVCISSLLREGKLVEISGGKLDAAGAGDVAVTFDKLQKLDKPTLFLLDELTFDLDVYHKARQPIQLFWSD